MNFPCAFCHKFLHVQFEGFSMCTTRCKKCGVIQYLTYNPYNNPNLSPIKYSIFAKYKNKIYSLCIQNDYDDAYLYLYPNDPEDTIVIVSNMSNANIKNKINPSNFLIKLPLLLTFS